MKRTKRRTMSSRNRSTRLPSTIGLAALLLLASPAMAYPDDPVPTLDFGETEKSVVVQLTFHDTLDADLEFVEVVPGPAHGWMGDPSILRIDLLDLDANVIRGFNAWHPLWMNYEDDAGQDRGAVLDRAAGDYPFPFLRNVATMKFTLVETQEEILSVDVIPHLHDFCRDNPADPDCENIVNRPPVCNPGGPYSEECAGAVTSVRLDGSRSDDPDGDTVAFAWSGSFAGGSATGATPLVEYSGYGQFTVDLTLSEGFGGTSTCSAVVDVVDTMAPMIECNAPGTILPSDAPVAFQANATDVCIGQIVPQITAFDCYAFTPQGRRIDKTESCRITFAGDTITILDSGGVGDVISWTVVAADDEGNPSTIECSVEVTRPGNL